MKTNIIKTILLTLLVGIFSLGNSVKAEFTPVVDGSSTGGADAAFTPTVGGSSTGGADPVFVPITGGSSTGGADQVFVPVTGGQSTGGADNAFVPVVGGGNTGGADVVPTPAPVVTPVSSGSNVGGGRSIFYTPVLTVGTSTSCNYLGSYLKFGVNNDSAQVIKLQTFLKNSEGINVDINGIFDNKTLEAVKAFQTKYTNDIMAPWGVKNSTGQVYYTTQKKINELSCKTTKALTPKQISDINAYKNSVATANINVGEIHTDIAPVGSSTTPVSPEVGSAKNTSQTAALGNIGFAGKVKNFVKWLFGY